MAILGAILVASNSEISKYGFVLFVPASLGFAIICLKKDLKYMALTQFLYLTINLFGVYSWLIK